MRQIFFWYNFFFKYILEIIEMVGGVKENAMGFLEQKPHHRRTKNFQKDKHV